MLLETNLQSCYQGPLHFLFLISWLHTSKATFSRPYGTGCSSGHGNGVPPIVRGPSGEVQPGSLGGGPGLGRPTQRRPGEGCTLGVAGASVMREVLDTSKQDSLASARCVDPYFGKAVGPPSVMSEQLASRCQL